MAEERRPRTWDEKYRLWARKQREDSPAFSESVTEVLPRVGPWAMFTQGAPAMTKAAVAFMAGMTYIVIVLCLDQLGGAGLSPLLMQQLNLAVPYVGFLIGVVAVYVLIYMQFALKDKIWRQVDPAIIRDPNNNDVYVTVLRIVSRPQRIWTPKPEAVAERLRAQRRVLEGTVDEETAGVLE
jgi:hypothetical protein